VTQTQIIFSTVVSKGKADMRLSPCPHWGPKIEVAAVRATSDLPLKNGTSSSVLGMFEKCQEGTFGQGASLNGVAGSAKLTQNLA
jgi:hypothetical protein